MSTDLIRKASIEELCAHRARALELYEQAARCIRDANAAAARCMNGQTFHGPSRHDLDGLGYKVDPPAFAEDMRVLVDRQLWRYLLNHTHLSDYLDAKAREDLEKSLKDKPPAADPATIEATLASLASNAGAMLERGVIELFRSLRPEFKRHDAFRMTCRFVLSNARGTGIFSGWSHWGRGRDYVVDLERICCVMQGKPVPDYAENVACKVDAAAHKEETTLDHGPLSLRWFKNGNVHVTITEPELVARLNQILAKSGGIPDARRRAA